jgi:protein-disulfide isomerase
MPSGKQSRRQRHVAAPPPHEREPRRASARVLLAVAGAVVLALVALGLAFALTGPSSKPAASTPQRGSVTNALSGAAAVEKLLDGIPQRGNVLGRPAAPVRVVVYSDLQCPFCRQFELGAMPALVQDYVRTGKASVELRTIAFIGPDSVRGRAAAIAAEQQGRLFDVTHLLFLHQGAENAGWLSDDLIALAAASVPGLDVAKLLESQTSPSVESRAAALDDQALADGIRSTPTILVGPSDGPLNPVTLTAPTDSTSVAAAIETALA